MLKSDDYFDGSSLNFSSDFNDVSFDFESYDQNNSLTSDNVSDGLIGTFDKSISWTSGNGESLNLYSDSYYSNYNGPNDFNWFMGSEWEQNNVDEEEEWR